MAKTLTMLMLTLLLVGAPVSAGPALSTDPLEECKEFAGSIQMSGDISAAKLGDLTDICELAGALVCPGSSSGRFSLADVSAKSRDGGIEFKMPTDAYQFDEIKKLVSGGPLYAPGQGVPDGEPIKITTDFKTLHSLGIYWSASRVSC